MKKINITTYKVSVRLPSGETKELDYGMKDSIVEMLFNPALKLNAVDLIKQNSLANKILDSGDELLLENEEYTRVKTALDLLQGLTKNDVEFVKRILDAEIVEVEVKD